MAIHYRVIGRTMAEKFNLNLPEYPGFDQIVELPFAGGD